MHANLRTKRELYCGLTNPLLVDAIRCQRPFLYVDHGYWARNYSFRVIVGATHLTRLLERPGNRVATAPISGIRSTPILAPPKRELHGTRGHIVVIPPSEVVAGVFRLPGGHRGWMDDIQNEIRRYTDRVIRIKKEKSPPLAEYCHGAHAVVTFGSVAGVEASIMGYPVFSGPVCPTLPLCAGAIADIESPREYDMDARKAWLNSLSYAQWTPEELCKMDITDYNYGEERLCA
jgi:hypothetical protein